VVSFHYHDGANRFFETDKLLLLLSYIDGNAWSYLRLVAYGFLRMSKCEVITNVELARQDSANRGLRYFQLHIS
jgi:hypothetical protein